MNRYQQEDKELILLKSAVENTNEAFVTIDSAHKVIFFNKAAEVIFGFKRNEVIGHDLAVIMSPNCSKDHYHAVENYLKTRIPKRIGHETEMVAVRKNGDEFPANISFSVSEVDRKFYFTGIVTDLTETKKLQEKIMKSERLASLGQIVAEITHEIKNPLMMIGGFANQLIRQSSDEKTTEKLKIISDEVSRLERLISELRQFYQPGALERDKINMGDLINEVMALVKQDCKKKNIHLEFSRKDSLFINGDRDKLKQVLLNLMKNGIEAMEDGGSLFIKAEVADEFIETTIADNGCGIPDCDKETIFSPFFTTKKNGTGLGLSISKSIIEAHEGGYFTMESEEGKGSIFKIRLPMGTPE